eukprot:352033-Chlamydomonas_euryale.AAC.1
MPSPGFSFPFLSYQHVLKQPQACNLPRTFPEPSLCPPWAFPGPSLSLLCARLGPSPDLP